jgi:hypothetical protein
LIFDGKSTKVTNDGISWRTGRIREIRRTEVSIESAGGDEDEEDDHPESRGGDVGDGEHVETGDSS